MNTIGVIVDGFKRVFGGSNVWLKHVSLFALTGILSLISTYFDFMKEAASGAMPDFGTIAFGIVVMLVISIYLGGYNLSFMHNSFDDVNPEILPEIDEKHFGVFGRALPLIFVWGLWMVLVYLLAIIPILGWIALLILLFTWFPFIQFVYAAYAKYFDKDGLYNIKLPIEYMQSTFGSLVINGLLFIPIWICAMLPGFLVGLCMGLSGSRDLGTAAYIGALLGGYLGFVVQLVWMYCIVQIYREKIEQNLD